MTVNSIIKAIDVNIVAGKDYTEREITSGFVGDLLSVVMGKAKEGCAWITIQSHFNIIAVATLINVACIIVTEGYEVEEEVIKKASEEQIPILSTRLSSYEVACKLSELGLK